MDVCAGRCGRAVVAGRSAQSLDCIVTKSQRGIVRTWAAVAGVLVVVAVFESWILAHWSWLRFVALLAIVVGVTAAKPRPFEENWLDRIVERHPLLKPWFVICAVAALCFAAATIIWHVPLNEDVSVRGLIAMFAALLGPPIIAIERERFEEAGKEGTDNAI